MDFKVIWSESAIADLRELVSYIGKDNAVEAGRFGALVLSKVGTLSSFPRIGRQVPEFRTEAIRQLVVGAYRVVYEMHDSSSTISVLRVWHVARDRLDEATLKPGN